LRGIGTNVFLLGVVSLLTDISSEMLYPLIPLFLTGSLGATVLTAAMIEGCAEMVGSLLRGVAGAWSDRTGLRKPFVLFGYSVSALSKGLLGWALSPIWVLTARVVDRAGKGVRSSPRDAMLAESTAPEFRGRAFGLHQSMDQLGAVAGPLLALPLLVLFHGDLRSLFFFALIPGGLSVLLLFVTRETGRGRVHPQTWSPLPWREMPAAFRRYLFISALFSLGNSADALLALRARMFLDSPQAVVRAFALFNVVTVLAALPAGMISDRLGRRRVVLAGWFLFGIAYAGFASMTGRAELWWLFAVYGIYAGIADGAARAYVVDLVPPALKASALGTHGMVTGVMAFCANLFAGALWMKVGPSAAFLLGAVCAWLALLCLLPARRATTGV